MSAKQVSGLDTGGACGAGYADRRANRIGGKNFHVVHKSAEVTNAVMQTVRGAFEYQGS